MKWRNHIQDLMHPPWSFLARGQSMRGARSVDSMHCWFIALWISCIYDHFVNNNVSFWLFFYYLVNRSTRWSALCQRLSMLFWYSQCCFFLHLQQPHKSHTGSVTTTTTNTLCIWTFEHIFIAGVNHVFHDVCIHFTLYLPVTSKKKTLPCAKVLNSCTFFS